MKNNYPLVSIIIDNWNGKSFLNDCLRSIYSQKYPSFEVIVIDDASIDDSVKFIQKKYPKAKIIQNSTHEGFARANMRGVREAKGTYLLFLNNDTTVTNNFLFPLVDLMISDSTVGAVQPKIKNLIDYHKLDDVVNFLTPFGFLYHYGYGENDSNKFEKKMISFSPKGACFLVKKEIFLQLGGFNSNYYCYFEETDFAWKLLLSNYRIYFEPASIIYHFGGGSLHNQTSFNREYFSTRNRINSLLTNLSFGWLMFVLPLHFIFLLFVFFTFILRGDFKTALSVPKAIIWNIENFKETLKLRNIVQKKIRKVSDYSIFGNLMKFPPLNYFKKFVSYYRSVDNSTRKL